MLFIVVHSTQCGNVTFFLPLTFDMEYGLANLSNFPELRFTTIKIQSLFRVFKFAKFNQH